MVSGASGTSSVKWGFALGAAAVVAIPLFKKIYHVFTESMGASMARAGSFPSIAVFREDVAEKRLLAATQRYLKFIDQIGNGEIEGFDYKKGGESVLSADCKKIVNGKVRTETREAFIQDLRNVREQPNSWTVKPEEIIPAANGRKVTLCLKTEMKNGGTFDATVVLTFNQYYLISELRETFAKADGDYNLGPAGR